MIGIVRRSMRLIFQRDLYCPLFMGSTSKTIFVGVALLKHFQTRKYNDEPGVKTNCQCLQRVIDSSLAFA